MIFHCPLMLTQKFLGVFIDNKLSFNKHVDFLVKKCSSRLFLMRKLKNIGLDELGLLTFYLTNIGSILAYAAPAWFSLLGDQNCERLEKVQRAALKVIKPDLEYDERLKDIPRLRYFLSDLSYVLVSCFLTILPEHPLELKVFSDLSYVVQKTT